MSQAAEIIKRLELRPHPEGGHFAETWRHEPKEGGRGAGTAIYFLLQAGERSHWHRIDASEIWHFYAGSPLRLQIHQGESRTFRLGSKLLEGEVPQVRVPPHAWQSAVSEGPFSLVGCTVSPAFDFDRFELAEPGWEPS